MIRTIAVLAAASFLTAALVTAKSAMAGSYVSYSFSFGSYGHGHNYGHHGYGFGHHYGYPYHYRHSHYYGYPYRYHYRQHGHHGAHFRYHGSTYPAPARHITVVRAVGTADPSLTFGYGNRARIDCKSTTGTSTVNGRQAIFGGTFCYDDYRRGYIVPGSQYFIGYAD